MSLLDIYAKTKAEIDAKDEAKKDLKEHKDSEYFELPDGKFGSTLLDVAHGKGKNDRYWTAFKFSIDYPQEYAGKKYSIFITLNETTSKGNPMPQAVLEKSMRYCLEIGALLGVKVPATDFAGDADANGLALAKTFEPAFNEGKLEVVKKSKPNPRNANFSYVDYYFNPYNRGLVQATKQLKDIKEINDMNKVIINEQASQPVNTNSAQNYFNHMQQPAQPSNPGQAWNQGYSYPQTAEVPFPEEEASQQPANQAQPAQKTQAMTQAQIESVLPKDTSNPNEITITKDDIPF